MSVHAADPFRVTPHPPDRDGRAALDRVPNAMSGHAREPFQVTPRAPDRGGPAAVLDRVPMP